MVSRHSAVGYNIEHKFLQSCLGYPVTSLRKAAVQHAQLTSGWPVSSTFSRSNLSRFMQWCKRRADRCSKNIELYKSANLLDSCHGFRGSIQEVRSAQIKVLIYNLVPMSFPLRNIFAVAEFLVDSNDTLWCKKCRFRWWHYLYILTETMKLNFEPSHAEFSHKVPQLSTSKL